MEVINKLVKIEKELILKGGRTPTLEELSTEMQKFGAQFTPQRISEIKKINIDLVSLDKPISNNENSNFSDFIREEGEESNPEYVASRSFVEEKLDDFLKSSLTKDERFILSLRFGLGSRSEQTVEQIAQAIIKDKKSKTF
ncbi:hypothetical protein PVNG_02428 [Plasmodium vivax North Korean]|uniref:RNA polymerase sigma-70 region 3 domain-containing protein n=1 Tax=Plasmodium vivax North Korean TaxID=1035514 RepID=A0A0J9TKM9_PLAVI|nr:hypothetical protein PVNG_02428 [Plasmodium vivax North Korean]